MSKLVLPWNRDAERTLIGAGLVDNARIDEGASLVHPADFYSDKHRLIWTTMLALRDRGTAVDLVTLKNELTRTGNLERAGGISEVAELVEGVPRAAAALAYARIIREAAVARVAIAGARDLARLAAEGSTAADIVTAAAAQADLLSMAAAPLRGTGSALRAPELHDRWGQYLARSRGGGSLMTGWRMVDDRSGGFLQGELITFVARPGVGKSAWAQNLCRNVLNADACKVAWYFSLEMPAAQWWERWVQLTLGRSRTWVQSHEAEAAEVRDASVGVRVVDTELPEVPAIVEAVRGGVRAGDRCDIVIIDHTDYIALPSGRDSTADKIRALFVSLKAAAKTLSVPIVVLHQGRAEQEGDGTKPPRARSSSGPEESSDLMIGAWRPGLHEQGGDPTELRIQTLKTRRTEAFSDSLVFEAHTMRIMDRDLRSAEEALGGAEEPRRWYDRDVDHP